MCGVDLSLYVFPSHNCIVTFSNHPGNIFLGAHNPDIGWRAAFPIREGFKLIFSDNNNFTVKSIDDVTAIKRLVKVGLSREESSSEGISLDEDYLEQLVSSVKTNPRGRYCCSVCGELCWQKSLTTHSCIIEHNDDPEYRILIIPELNEFYPIIDKGQGLDRWGR